MLLDPGSGCASPLSIDGVAFGVGTWSTSRFSTVQVGQTVLDRYKEDGRMLDNLFTTWGDEARISPIGLGEFGAFLVCR